MKSIGERALEIYERLKPELERDYRGKYVVINVETEEYVIGDGVEAAKLAAQKLPKGPWALLEIGNPIVYA